jgi:thiol:disulfide interchange protein DsbC
MRKFFFVVTVALFSHFAIAADTETEQVAKTLQELMPAAKPDAIKPAPIPGLYEAVYGSQVIYVTKDGRFMIEGDVYDVQKRTNLTEAVRTSGRAKALAALDKEQLIVFRPKDKETKFVITAFTDIDCGYCRKLHSEIKQYNDLGIEVRYAAFPRSGLQTPSYFKAVSVWCAKDRNNAMTIAKGGAKLEELEKLAQVENNKTCKDAIARQLNTAREVGVTGTPSLFTESGQIIPGYVPAERLIKMLTDANQS